MELNELLQKDILWVQNIQNLALRTYLSCSEDGFDYRIDCEMHYDLEQNKWNYEHDTERVLESLGFEDKREFVKEFLVEKTKEKREVLEKIAEGIETSLHFTNDYLLIPSRHVIDRRKLIFKNATMNGKEVLLGIFFTNKKEVHSVRLGIKGEDDQVENFNFSWEFAKKHMKGMEAFEEFLFNKSKDRLRLLL